MHEHIRPPQEPQPLSGVRSVVHWKRKLLTLGGRTPHVRNNGYVCSGPVPLVHEHVGYGLYSAEIRIETGVKKNPHACQTNALLSSTASLVGATGPLCDLD